jgi:hypothetical protein
LDLKSKQSNEASINSDQLDEVEEKTPINIRREEA